MKKIIWTSHHDVISIPQLFFFSFLINFVWEVSQMPLFADTGMGTRNMNEFIIIHWRVSFFDALAVTVAYILVSLLLKNKHWFNSLNIGWIIFWAGLVSWQTGMEYYSVYVANRWTYSSLMPVLFGVGLIPLLQMIITPAAALLLIKKSKSHK